MGYFFRLNSLHSKPTGKHAIVDRLYLSPTFYIERFVVDVPNRMRSDTWEFTVAWIYWEISVSIYSTKEPDEHEEHPGEA